MSLRSPVVYRIPAALAYYETCRRVLREELGIEPEGETLALYELIKAGDQGSLLHPQPTPPRHNLPQQLTPFVGREEELTRLTERLDGADYRLITLVGQGGAGRAPCHAGPPRRLLPSARRAGGGIAPGSGPERLAGAPGPRAEQHPGGIGMG